MMTTKDGHWAEIEVEIAGTAPYRAHRWHVDYFPGQKPPAPPPPRTPEEEAYQRCYWMPDGRAGINALAFKAAMLGTIPYRERRERDLRSAIHVVGQGPEPLVPLMGTKVLWEDRCGQVLRYSYVFYEWHTRFTVRYDAAVVSREEVLDLLQVGGRGGVGDWRPSAPKSYTGSYGTFAVTRVVEPAAA